MRKFLIVAAVAALTAVPVAAQGNFENVEIQSSEVAGAVHMLVGAGGNIGVSAGEDGVLIVDDQFAPLVPKIRAALAEISPGDLEFVLNTHYHGDHTGGNEAFGAEAPIVAHANVRKRLASEQRRGDQVTPAQPKAALPVVTFDEGLSLHFNGEEIQVRHFPNSHTDGDAVVHFTGSGVFHLGDLFFAGRFPFVDVASGGNALGLLDSITRLLEAIPADAKIIPGHGPLASHEDLALYREMIESTLTTVRTARGRGDDLAAIQAAGFDERWKDWSWGFINAERWAQILYESLEQEEAGG